MADSIFTPGEVKADLDRLAKLLKRISVEWEMFLAQSTKWPPHQRAHEIEAIIRHYSKAVPQRTVDRFRFNTLVHRYQTNSERWRRRLRLLEETGHSRHGARPGRRPAEGEDTSLPQTLARSRLRDAKVAPDQLRDLYLTFKRARKARGQSVAKLDYRSFAERVGAHVSQAAGRSSDKDLELRVDEVGGKVKIVVKARSSSR